MLIIGILLLLPLTAYSQSNIVPTIIGDDTLYCMPKERLSLISNRLVELQFNVDSLTLANTQIPLYLSIIDQKEQQIITLRRIKDGCFSSNKDLESVIKNKDLALTDARKVMESYILELQLQREVNVKQKRKHRTVTGILLGAVTAFATTTLIFSLK